MRICGRIAWCTIEYCSNDTLGEICLLIDIQEVRNLRCVGTIGPGLVRGVGHGSDVCDEGTLVEGGQGEREKLERALLIRGSRGYKLGINVEYSRMLLNHQRRITSNGQHTRGFFILGQHRLQGHDSHSLIQLTLQSSRFKLRFSPVRPRVDLKGNLNRLDFRVNWIRERES